MGFQITMLPIRSYYLHMKCTKIIPVLHTKAQTHNDTQETSYQKPVLETSTSFSYQKLAKQTWLTINAIDKASRQLSRPTKARNLEWLTGEEYRLKQKTEVNQQTNRYIIDFILRTFNVIVITAASDEGCYDITAFSALKFLYLMAQTHIHTVLTSGSMA